MITKIKENLIAFWIALVLTWGVIIFINSGSNNLATDVLWIKKTWQDINVDTLFVFRNNNGEIISNKNIENVSSISLELLYNPEKVQLSQENITSNYNISLWTKNNGFNIIIQDINQIKKNDVLLNIKNITKEQYDNINIGHIQVIDNNTGVLELTNLK